MTKNKNKKVLEVDDDQRFQQRAWKVQRASWVVIALIVIAGLLGLFGKGPLSYAKAHDEKQSIQIDYERFGRFETATELKFSLKEISQKQVRLHKNYIEAIQIENIMPTPIVMASGNWFVYSFNTSHSSEPLNVTFYIKPKKIGLLKGVLADENTSPLLSFNQFIYP